MLPLQELLQSSWNSHKYKQGDPQADELHRRPFMVEESSKVTLSKLNGLMRDQYKWGVIRMVATLAREAELVGNWGERCGCPDHQPPEFARMKLPGKKRQPKVNPDGGSCCFKGCRAPELACGLAMSLQGNEMIQNRALFNLAVSQVPQHKRAELHGSWSKASGKLWGV